MPSQQESDRLRKVTLCYCVNRKMHIPLCVSLYTALEHLDPAYHLDIRVFHSDLQESDVAQLEKSLDQTGKSYDLQVDTISLDRFSTSDSLHGDRMAYGRILLPRLLSDHEKLIYLDADTVVLTSLARLHQEDVGSHALGAVPAGKLRYALENKFFRAKGLDLEAQMFNSGVLLFGVDEWNKEDWTERVLEFTREHQGECRAADQTALNVVFHKQFYQLPSKFNHIVHPSADFEAEKSLDQVIHFVGSPKPWDLFGSWLHDGHGLFERYIGELGLSNALFYRKLHWKNLYRTARISRSYAKVFSGKAAG